MKIILYIFYECIRICMAKCVFLMVQRDIYFLSGRGEERETDLDERGLLFFL